VGRILQRREGEGAELRKANGHAEPLNVRYWSIGNENWGGHEIGASTPEKWGPLVKESARLMLGADPNLAADSRGHAGPGLDAAALEGGRRPPGLRGGAWLLLPVGLKTPCRLHDLHYAFRGTRADDRRRDRRFGGGWPRDRTQIAFDEWNLRGWHHPGFPASRPNDGSDPNAAALIQAREKNNIASQYTMADALFSASFLNGCLRHAKDVGMANIAPIVNTRGPLYVHPRESSSGRRSTCWRCTPTCSRPRRPVRTGMRSAPHGGRSVATIDALHGRCAG